MIPNTIIYHVINNRIAFFMATQLHVLCTDHSFLVSFQGDGRLGGFHFLAGMNVLTWECRWLLTYWCHFLGNVPQWWDCWVTWQLFLVDITPRTHRASFSTFLLDHATLIFLDNSHSNLAFDFYFGFDFDPLDDPWFWISFCVSSSHSHMFVLSTWPFTNYFPIEVSEFLIILDINTAVSISPFGRLPPLLTKPFLVYSYWLLILYLTSSLRIPGQTPPMISLPLLSHTPVSLPSLPLSSALLNAYELRNGLLNTEQLGTWQICSLPSGVGISKNACHFFGHFTGSVFCIIINPTRFGVTQETHLWEGLGGSGRVFPENFDWGGKIYPQRVLKDQTQKAWWTPLLCFLTVGVM